MSSIAFINNYFPSLSGTFIYQEVLGLRKRGISIKTFSIRKPDIKELSKESHELVNSTTYLLPVNILEFMRAVAYFLIIRSIKLFQLLLFLMTRKYENSARDRLRTFFHFCEGIQFAKLIKKDRQIKHIHAHYASHPATVAYVASILTHIPFSFTAHAYDIWEDRLFVGDKLAEAKFAITCTNFGKKRTIEIYGSENSNKIVPIYHGIDIKKFVPKNSSTQEKEEHIFTILHVGRLHPEKAQKTIIQACSNIKNCGYKFRCNIIGEGEIRHELQEYIDSLNLQNEIKLVGRVDNGEIPRYYQESDVFVLTSITENLPNVLLESLATEVPVVASHINGIPELVKDRKTGLLIKPANSDDLTKALQTIMDDKEFSHTLGENGRQFIEETFDIEKCLDQLVDLYRTQGVIN